MKDLILIIDMQNVYAAGGQWCCPGTEAASDKILKLIQGVKPEEAEIRFTRFLAPEHPQGVWADYNRENAEVNQDAYANELLESLQEISKSYPMDTKSTYSSLENPEVRQAALRADHVVVAGVVAECCVLATVMGLIDAGCSVIYLTDAVAGISRETEKATELILSGLEPLHVRRMTVQEYLSRHRGRGQW